MEVYEDILKLIHNKSAVDYQLVRCVVDYYENIISGMPGNVYWLNKDCRSVGCNQNVLNMLGLKKPIDFYGLTFEDQAKLCNWSNSQAESFKKDTEEVIRTGLEKANVEEPLISGNDQRDTYFLTTRIPLFNKNYDVIGVVGISTDITEHKRVQEALKKALDGMALVSASIAHEVRTPLAGIKSALFGLENCLPIMLKGYKLAVENKLMSPELHAQHLTALQELVNNIDKKVDQCNSVIDILLNNLAYNKIDSSDFQPCSMRACLDNALEKYTFASNQRALVKVNIQQDFYFYGKITLITHILFNLFKNAFYFIQKAGKGDINIWTEQGQNGSNQLHFKDTGQGIPERSLPYIFEQFFSENTHHGTGIGLAFSKMAMKAHHGDITCRSQFGEFAEFILTFPNFKPQ